MPCNASYINPTKDESNKKETSEFICFVDKQLGLKTPKI